MKTISNWGIKKTLVVCSHGLSVLYDATKYVSMMPQTLCNHIPFNLKELKTIEEVIEWVESVRQPRWVKSIGIGKYKISLVKY